MMLYTLVLGLAFTAEAQTTKVPTCDAAEFHQFDFWAGSWQVRSGDKTVGYSRIEPTLNGCALIENWYGVDGDIGKSINFYDRRTGRWRQVYIGINWNIDYSGSAHDGGMQFATGDTRLTFTPLADGSVRQHKTRAGNTVYDFTYLRHNGPDPAWMTNARDTTQRCLSPSSREFDFWAGDWDVFGPLSNMAGTNRVEPVAGGCILYENWSGRGGGDGKSFNFFDAASGEWRQVWVAAGGTLDLHGKWEGTHLRLTGEVKGANGAAILQRITWTPNANGTVRQHWEQSRDAGVTWTTAFDGTYLRRATV